jgi:hypothetical protein
MAGPVFEAAFRPGARQVYQNLNQSDRGIVDRLVQALEADPYIDGRTKFHFAAEIVPLAVLVQDEWAIVYRISGWVVEIWGLRRIDAEWRRRHHIPDN